MAGGWRRRVRWVGGLLVGLVALVLVLPPLILRGRVLRWAAARATSGLCGEFDLGDGHLGLSVMPDLLLGRPFTVELDEAHVRAPDGTELIGVARVTARVAIARRPWRITLDDAVAERGQWKLVDGGPPGSRFVDAFRQVPAGGSRATCSERRPKGHGGHALSSGASLVVRDLRLEEVDTELSFRDWGLKLPRGRAHGTLAVGVPGSAGILFEARDVVVPGGSLRVGKVGTRGMTTATFDEVVITSVAATTAQPTDIVLTVGRARTGRSILSGKADFQSVFPVPGRPRGPPGMRLEAKWTDMADVLSRIEASWLPPGATLEQVGLGGAISGRLDGPYKALTGTITAKGAHAQLEVTMDQGRRATADVRADGLEVAPLLDAKLHPFLAGRASGRLRAHVQLAARASEIEAVIDDADLALDRVPGGLGPRHVDLRVGASARRAQRASSGKVLSVDLARAQLHEGTLELEGARAQGPVLSVTGRLALALAAPPAVDPTGDPPPAPRIDVTLDARLKSLSGYSDPGTFDASGAAKARLTGPLNHLRASVTFASQTWVALGGERFHAPPTVTAALDDGTLVISELRLPHDGGGEVTARLRGDMGRDLGGHLEIRHYPVARVPAFGQIKPPYVLGAPLGSSLADVLEGTFDAVMNVHGTVKHPWASGTATLTNVRLVERPLPDGRFEVRLAPFRAKVVGTLGPTLSVEGEGASGPHGLTVAANMTFREFAVATWLPRPLDEMIATVTGKSKLTIEPGRGPRAPAALRLTGPAGEMSLEGTLTRTSVEGAAARGRIKLAGLRPVWSRALVRAEGDVDVDLRGGVDYAHPTLERVTGTVAIADALRTQPKHTELVLEAAPGGRITIDGRRLSTEGLAVTTPGARAQLHGEVQLDAEEPGRSLVALAASGQLDAGALIRRISISQLASAAGSAMFEARASGEAAAPVFSGEARFQGVELRPALPGWPTVRIDGAIEASGHTLRTSGLRILTSPAGTLTVGTPATPASVEILSLDPPRLGRVDVPVAAHALRVGGPSSSLEIGALDLALRLDGDTRALTLRGDVGITGARFDPKRKKPSAPGPSRPWFESLPPHLTLDLRLHGPDDAVRITVPGPDVRLAFDCHVMASRQGAQLSGRLRGDGLYSRMAITVYDWFKSEDVRACRVIK